MLALVGGKAANLGELTNAKLPVPPGFCVTTNAYEQIAVEVGLQSVLARYVAPLAGKIAMLSGWRICAQAARNCLLAATIPPEIADAISEAYGVWALENLSL